MRLEHLLMKHLVLSRREMKKLIKNEAVLIDGVPATHVSNNVDATLQVITVNGTRIHDDSQKYYMLNKPQGVISATTDKEHTTVIDLFTKENVEGLYPLGRLDGDTEGLLLVTNNGPLGYRMLNPDQHIEKEYYVEVNGPLDEDAVEIFKRGVVFHGGYQCKPSTLTIIESSDSLSRATVTISEGKFHQVKRMLEYVGNEVVELKRVSIGNLSLDEKLELGEYREITNTELEEIFK